MAKSISVEVEDDHPNEVVQNKKLKYSITLIKYRKLYMLMLILFLCFTSGCTTGVSLSNVIQKELEKSNVKKSKIVKLGDFSNLSYDRKEVSLSEEVVEKLVKETLEQFDKLIKHENKRYVEEGDFVIIEYESVCEGKVIDSGEERTLKVGAGYFDETAEKHMVGAEKGKTYSVEIIIPEGNGEFSRKKEITTYKIKEILYLQSVHLTDEFVQKEYGLETVEEFYAYVKENQENEIKMAQEIERKNYLMRESVELCSFYLDEDEVLDMALTIYNEYLLAADSYSVNMEEYMRDFLGITGDIYDACYEEAKEKIKRLLMIGAIAHEQEITVEGDDFYEWLEKKGYSFENPSSDEEKKAMLQVEYLKSEVLQYLENSTRRGE